MARIGVNPYTWKTTNLRSIGVGKLGQCFDGVDSTYGRSARFRIVKHVNAVTVVAGHCASFVSYADMTVTNDVSGGASGNSIGVVAGAYVSVPANGDYCCIQTRGYHGTLLGDGSVAAGEGIAYEATDGTWDTVTTGEQPCGSCLLADTGSPATFPGILMVPE